MFQLPRALTAHLALGAIPVGGTYTNQNVSPLGGAAGQVGPAELCCLVYYLKNAGAATGQPRFRLEWRTSTGLAFFEPVVDATVVVAAEPRGRMKTYLGEWDGPIFDAVVTNGRWHYTFPIPPAAFTFRLLMTEVTANAGTASIDYMISGVG